VVYAENLRIKKLLQTDKLPDSFTPPVAFNAVVVSNVPMGSGLSSSAALE
jgi:galactokinase